MAGGWSQTVQRYGVHCEWRSALGELKSLELVIEAPAAQEDDELEPGLRWETGQRGESETSACLPGSVLDDLGRVARDLAVRTWWPEPLAVWFILTGEVPQTPAVQVVVRQSPPEPARQARLMLQVQPWVSHVCLRKTYRDAQRWALGREKRAIAIETLVRFRFVHELRARDPELMWPAIAKAWANRCKARAKGRRMSWRTLWSDYDRTRQSLLIPDLALGRSADDMAFAVEASKRYRKEELERFKRSPTRRRADPKLEPSEAPSKLSSKRKNKRVSRGK